MFKPEKYRVAIVEYKGGSDKAFRRLVDVKKTLTADEVSHLITIIRAATSNEKYIPGSLDILTQAYAKCTEKVKWQVYTYVEQKYIYMCFFRESPKVFNEFFKAFLDNYRLDKSCLECGDGADFSLTDKENILKSFLDIDLNCMEDLTRNIQNIARVSNYKSEEYINYFKNIEILFEFGRELWMPKIKEYFGLEHENMLELFSQVLQSDKIHTEFKIYNELYDQYKVVLEKENISTSLKEIPIKIENSVVSKI